MGWIYADLKNLFLFRFIGVDPLSSALIRVELPLGFFLWFRLGWLWCISDP
jgi:hypothetical protein